MINITEEQFEEQYTPIKNHLDENASFDGCMFETFDDEYDFVKRMAEQNKVWTIIEGDNNKMYYSTGVHLVNRLGFLVTEEPYKFETEVTIILEFDVQDKKGQWLEVGDDVDVDANLSDNRYDFRGTINSFDGSFVIVEDQEGDCFSVEGTELEKVIE